MSSSSLSPPSDTDMEIDESDLLPRLQRRRKELDAEIEAFRALKESEYKAFERKLREEYKLRKRKREGDKDGGQISNNNNATTTDASPPYATAANTATPGRENGNVCSTWSGVERGSQVSLGLGESKLDDALGLELPNALPAQQLKSRENSSPPFDKDLQAAFTPRYLPLLDNNYQSPPTSPPPNKIMSSPPQSPKELLPKIATIPSRSGNSPGSPAVPLASSLKSSSGSSFGTISKSAGIRQKSPKKVTFQFEDESSVPSRSSPPPAKVHWSLVDNIDNEYDLEDGDGFVESAGDHEVVEVGEAEFDDSGKVEQIENAAKLVNLEVTQGVELVVPTFLLGTSTESRTLVDDDSFEEVQFGDETSGNGSKGVNGDLEKEFDTETTDDDEEDLFDMDETVAERKESPPHRDYAALLNTSKPQSQRSPFSGQSFPPLPSFTPVPSSIPAPQVDPLLTFGKGPGMRSGFTAVRGGISASFNPSLSLEPLTSRTRAGEEPHTAPVASSLPNIGWGETSGKASFVPTPGGRFRRRSIVKYDVPDEDDASIGKFHPNIPEEDEPPLGISGRSPNAASLPMAISRNSPLAALSGSTSSKSPTPLRKYASAATIPEVLDEAPVSGRPSPVSSPLGADLTLAPGNESIKRVSSADILADVPTSEPPSSSAKNDSVSSYRLTSPPPFAPVLPTSPYRTAYAAEVAASALDGELESVVGGVDGGTGLDPDVSSFQAAAGTSINRRRSGSVIVPQEMRPERMSLGMRMAFEEMKGKK
ncbi:hypothetical protein L873DRAFT_1674119 [Choiromyces venosus 120613-1]|uniref:Uncharacterized protein n=1 Tax=Choiromyces venosus 120613-1 TaxID=1336337 RepID=A0A3N4K7Z2_9PEZI|nr:hypothetical protein L873DRAFT_1674119 [Choiromyces venosus 120613-1]